MGNACCKDKRESGVGVRQWKTEESRKALGGGEKNKNCVREDWIPLDQTEGTPKQRGHANPQIEMSETNLLSTCRIVDCRRVFVDV